LNAWRGVKEPEPEQEKRPKVIEYEKNKNPGSFFANLGGESDWNVNCLPSFNDGGCDPIAELSGMVGQETRESCWQCYKLVPTIKIIDLATKKFCSEKCTAAFRRES